MMILAHTLRPGAKCKVNWHQPLVRLAAASLDWFHHALIPPERQPSSWALVEPAPHPRDHWTGREKIADDGQPIDTRNSPLSRLFACDIARVSCLSQAQSRHRFDKHRLPPP
ncbi:hypothetical protein S40285_10338 [Stachybotrys chlorohalonatus IBT 40285]|uniref:Uncharacterized protein n=1 Tax=Stachybotrys chlorohalonatus (strain IBT 40285) TaxID=1283841 RepID=A0A084QJ49_STAC4|nr:hypothetical protein S40285_10338 [Stachybotrys chlorohalonata IBT 40285]